jgi:hypothetical protein
MTTFRQLNEPESKSESPFPRRDPLPVQNYPRLTGAIERLHSMIEHLAPMGYEDETGFHYGVDRR